MSDFAVEEIGIFAEYITNKRIGHVSYTFHNPEEFRFMNQFMESIASKYCFSHDHVRMYRIEEFDCSISIWFVED